LHCRTCEYPLWNLKARQCPECGSAFKPSEFEFVVNSVRFCCPQCDQAYYGLGVKGHLVPQEFGCVSCGRRLAMDEAVLRPAAGVEEEHTRPDHSPWQERRERGFVRAFFSTIGFALVNQSRLVRGLSAVPKVRSAWWFAFIATIMVAGAAIVPFILLIGLPIAFAGGGAGGVSRGVTAFSWFAAVMIVISLFALVLWALITHGLLAITGPKKGSLARTMEVFGYSAGANVISAVPCVGIYIGWIWWVISATLLVKEAHGISGGRAALVTLPVPLLGIGGVITFFIIAIAQTNAMMATINTMPNPVAGGTQSVEVTTVVDALTAYHAQWAALPAHALDLVHDDQLMASDLVSVDTATDTSDVPAGSSNLAAFERLSVIDRQQVVEETAATLPAGTVAHRFGDFVFTYHGLDMDADVELWIVVMCGDPDVDPNAAAQGIVVGQVDGTVAEIPADRVPMMLLLQNQQRKFAGHPPLPDPRTVTHGNPMVGTLSPEVD